MSTDEKLDIILRTLQELAANQGPRREWLSIRNAARVVDMDPKHIRRALKRGELPYSNVAADGARRPTYRIARKDLAEWMASKRPRRGPSKSACDELVARYFPKSA